MHSDIKGIVNVLKHFLLINHQPFKGNSGLIFVRTFDTISLADDLVHLCCLILKHDRNLKCGK